MSNAFVLLASGLVSVALCCLFLSLWENPQDGRSPRQRLGGVFHRLLAALRNAFFSVIYDLVHLWQYPMYWLHCKDGFDGYPLVPMWLVNLPYGSLPDSWKQELLGVWRRRHNEGGQP